MKFKIGDKVTLLNEVGEGVVTAILNPNLIEVEIDDFPYKFSPNDLILLESLEIGEVPNPEEEQIELDEEILEQVKSIPKQFNEDEIDLHFHNLMDYHDGLSNTEKLHIQTSAMRERLDYCIANNKKKLIVVHGIGKGVLKAEVRRILREEYNLEFFDAPLRKYGWGATQVNFY